MSSLRRAAIPVVLVCAVIGASPALAAGGYADVLRVYEAQGTVPACQFSTATLQRALRGVDVYGQQYFADFTNAIQTALAQRAAGECSGSSSGGVAGARSDPSLRIALPPVTAATRSGLPLPLVLLLVLGLVAAGVLAAGAVRRCLGLGATPGGAWRQLWGETAWRGDGWLAEQRDRRRAATRSRALSRSAPRPRG